MFLFLSQSFAVIFYTDCKVYICDFHRQQAWERWLSKGANGATAFKADILCRFRRIAHAATEMQYKEAVASLEGWEVWNSPEMKAARDWFNHTWQQEHKVISQNCRCHSITLMSILIKPHSSMIWRIAYSCFFQRWVWAFKKDRLLSSVSNTNGVERQNKSFKYEYLEGNKGANLSTMLTILVEDFVPDKYTK